MSEATPEKEKPNPHAVMMADIAAQLNGIVATHDAKLVATMTAGFLAKLYNALLHSDRIHEDELATTLDQLVDLAFAPHEDASRLVLPEHLKSRRLH